MIFWYLEIITWFVEFFILFIIPLVYSYKSFDNLEKNVRKLLTYWIIFTFYYEYILPIYHFIGGYISIVEYIMRIISVVSVIILT